MKATAALNSTIPKDEPLFAHQEFFLDIAKDQKRYCFWADCGTGKTRVGLELHRLRPVKTVIVCPINLIQNAWIEDAERFTPEINIVSLRGSVRNSTKKKRLEAINGEWDYGLINFESFRSHIDDLLKVGVKRLIIDESSKLKDHRSLTTRKIFKLAWGSGVEECYLLSGTPAPNSEMEYYSQIRCVSQDLFPPVFYAFRNKYFFQPKPQQCPWLWRKKPEMMKDFEEKIASVATFIKKSDCLDLPEQIWTNHLVEMDKEQGEMYQELEREWIVRHGDDITIAVNALSEIMKLRQITAGFTIPQTGSPKKIGHAKSDALAALLEEIGNKQVIILGQFTCEIMEILDTLKGKTTALFGKPNMRQAFNKDYIPSPHTDENIRAFKDGSRQYLVGHPASMAHGLTFVNCSYMIWNSLSYSYEDYYQANQRIHRAGQFEACNYYHLIVPGTVDMEIYSAVKNKQKVALRILDKLRRGEWK